jgi:hypothetical protein
LLPPPTCCGGQHRRSFLRSRRAGTSPIPRVRLYAADHRAASKEHTEIPDVPRAAPRTGKGLLPAFQEGQAMNTLGLIAVMIVGFAATYTVLMVALMLNFDRIMKWIDK